MKTLRLLITLFLVLVFGGGCNGSATYPAGQKGQITQALESSIILYNRDGNLICAGQRVSPTEILTAWHCVLSGSGPEDALMLLDLVDPNLESEFARSLDLTGNLMQYSTYDDTVEEPNEKKRKKRNAEVTFYDPETDVALLYTGKSSQPYVRFTPRDPVIGEPVFAVGHPAGLTFSVTLGHVSTPCRFMGDSGPCWLQADISIWGGSSGGGLYDGDGFMIGIASAMGPPGFGFFAGPSAIADLFKSAR